MGSIAAIRAVPGSSSYLAAVRVRLPPSRPFWRGLDPLVLTRIAEEQEPLSGDAKSLHAAVDSEERAGCRGRIR